MGLDSIELVMEIEKFFGIQIPDQEAEKLYTVQKMADSVAGHLNITNDSKELRDSIVRRLQDSIGKFNSTATEINLTDLISQHISIHNKNEWQDFKDDFGLHMPRPEIVNDTNPTLLTKIKSALTFKPLYNWFEIAVDQYVTAICANNYLKLIDNKNILNTYEIYVAVVGITVDKIGVDYLEVGPEKSFTSDLGVD